MLQKVNKYFIFQKDYLNIQKDYSNIQKVINNPHILLKHAILSKIIGLLLCLFFFNKLLSKIVYKYTIKKEFW